MTPIIRRVLQALLYEFFAVAFVTPMFALLFSHPFFSTFVLAILMSAIALTWNYVFNFMFERWEMRQATKGRSFWRRLMHGLLFEGGLVVLLVPLMAYWLKISLMKALIADLGILVFFFLYAIGFTWVFDRIFGLPQSAR